MLLANSGEARHSDERRAAFWKVLMIYFFDVSRDDASVLGSSGGLIA